jgi:DDE superfamily endonuclease
VTRTPVAELDAEVVERLEEYVGEFVADFGLITRRYWASVYLQGLLLDGERKSIEPLSRRVSVPGWHGDTEQALQQFVNQSVWDHQAALAAPRRWMRTRRNRPALFTRSIGPGRPTTSSTDVAGHSACPTALAGVSLSVCMPSLQSAACLCFGLHLTARESTLDGSIRNVYTR